MDINKVVFGNFSVGARNARPQKNDEENKQVQENAQSTSKNVDAEEVLSALNFAGIQNKFQFVGPEKKEINPADYLTEDRIADIEAMMGKFEDGVSVAADAIENEFPGFFKADVRNALAAKIYAEG